MSKPRKPPPSIDDLVGTLDRPDPTAPSEAVSHLPAKMTAAPPPPQQPQGGRPVTTFVAPADRTMLKTLVASEEKTLHEFLHEAINDALHKRGLPPLTPQAANRSVPGAKGSRS